MKSTLNQSLVLLFIIHCFEFVICQKCWKNLDSLAGAVPASEPLFLTKLWNPERYEFKKPENGRLNFENRETFYISCRNTGN